MVKELVIKDNFFDYKISFIQSEDLHIARLEFKISQNEEKLIDGYIAIPNKIGNRNWLELHYTYYGLKPIYEQFKDYNAIAKLISIRRIKDMDKPILDDKLFRYISCWIYNQKGNEIEKKILTAIELKNYDELKPILRTLIIGEDKNIFYKYSEDLLDDELYHIWFFNSNYYRKEPYIKFDDYNEFRYFFYKEIWNKLEEKQDEIELEIFSEFQKYIIKAVNWYIKNKEKLNKRKIWVLDILRALYLVTIYERYKIPYRHKIILNKIYNNPFDIVDLKEFRQGIRNIIKFRYIEPLIEEKV